jgi:hypothetical protein
MIGNESNNRYVVVRLSRSVGMLRRSGIYSKDTSEQAVCLDVSSDQ